jgi:hypothetical protein
MANKYLEKIAGLEHTIRRGITSFGEHLSGKAVEKARMEKSMVHGMGMASKIERNTHKDISDMYASAKDWDRHADEYGRHSTTMYGQDQMRNHILHSLESDGHFNKEHIGTNVNSLVKKRTQARAVVGGAGATALGGAFAAGHHMGKKKQ